MKLYKESHIKEYPPLKLTACPCKSMKIPIFPGKIPSKMLDFPARYVSFREGNIPHLALKFAPDLFVWNQRWVWGFPHVNLWISTNRPPWNHRPTATGSPPLDQATRFPSLITPVRFSSSHFKLWFGAASTVRHRWFWKHKMGETTNKKQTKIHKMCEIIRVIPVSNKLFNNKYLWNWYPVARPHLLLVTESWSESEPEVRVAEIPFHDGHRNPYDDAKVLDQQLEFIHGTWNDLRYSRKLST